MALSSGAAHEQQIAQALFVTVRTVEMHLGYAYRKLEISSREALEPELFSPEGVCLSGPEASR